MFGRLFLILVLLFLLGCSSERYYDDFNPLPEWAVANKKDVRADHYESGFIVSSNSDVDMAFAAIRSKLSDLGYLECGNDNVIELPIVSHLSVRDRFYFKFYGDKISVVVADARMRSADVPDDGIDVKVFAGIDRVDYDDERALLFFREFCPRAMR